jgi:hypothetical protein
MTANSKQESDVMLPLCSQNGDTMHQIDSRVAKHSPDTPKVLPVERIFCGGESQSKG